MSQQREGKYKTELTKRIYKRFPGRCIVVRLDANRRQGISDMGILFEGGFWCLLEAKTSEDAERQPNQEFYIHKLNDMCFAAFIYPEIEEAVLNELEEEFQRHWEARIS